MAGDVLSFALLAISSLLIIISPLAIGVVLFSIILSIGITYYMMRNSDYIMSKIGQREYRAINRLMGMLLIAIAVQFVINGIWMVPH